MFFQDRVNSSKKGKFLKQCSWYSNIKKSDEVDPVWHANRYMAEEVADQLLKSKDQAGKQQANNMVEKVMKDWQAQSGSECSKAEGKEAHKAALRDMRKKVGNALLVAPKLLNAGNLVNGRIMLLVSRLPWTEQSFWSLEKTTAQKDREIAVKHSIGLGEKLLKQMWKNTLFHAIELHRLG